MDVDTQSQLSYPQVNGYRIGEEIGGGGFSKVFRAFDELPESQHPPVAEGSRPRSRVLACKVVNLFVSPAAGYGQPNVKELQKEVQVHKSLSGPGGNPYILDFVYSEIVERERQQQGYVPGLYMLLELAIGGDLFDKIAPDVGVPEDLAKFYFAQMASGIEFLHAKGIAHRDLKPENLLLAPNGNLKISDFGLCAVFRYKGKTRLLSGRCGSLPYVAPELGGAGTGYAAEPVDIWGMGVVLYTLLVGNTPWDEPSERSPEYHAYLAGDIFQYDPWTRIRGQAKAILLGLLTVDPNQRLTMAGIKAHPWCMTPSQLSREQLAPALTQGMRSNGMMAVADPTFTSQASQIYAAERTGRLRASQYSQFTQQESQFMRGTGNITQGGDLNNNTTRFWLALSPADALALLVPYLQAVCAGPSGEANVEVDEVRGVVRVLKPAGEKTVQGRLVVQANDSLQAEGQTLVDMKRERLQWRAFWWSIVRSQQVEPYVVRGDS